MLRRRLQRTVQRYQTQRRSIRMRPRWKPRWEPSPWMHCWLWKRSVPVVTKEMVSVSELFWWSPLPRPRASCPRHHALVPVAAHIGMGCQSDATPRVPRRLGPDLPVPDQPFWPNRYEACVGGLHSPPSYKTSSEASRPDLGSPNMVFEWNGARCRIELKATGGEHVPLEIQR